MNTSLRPIGLNRTVDLELLAVSASIDAHQRALNEEGVWLFLAVLGCWSVSPDWMRLVALLIALVFFALRYLPYRPDGREFKTEFSLAEGRIRALQLEADVREEGLQRLRSLKEDRLGGLRPLYKVPGFALAWFSWGATVLNTVYGIWHPLAA